MIDERGRASYRKPGEFPYGHQGLTSMGALCVLLADPAMDFPAAGRNRLLDEAARSCLLRESADLYRDYFLSHAAAFPRGIAPGWIEGCRRALAGSQVDRGSDQGSWAPSDAWASAGGRVYSTAMAALILQTDRHGHRLAGWVSRSG